MSRVSVDKIAQNLKPHGQDGVWIEIRKLQVFTAAEIHKSTDIHRRTVADYIRRLEAGGYVEKHVSYEDTLQFKLMRDAGVHAPRLKKNGDPVTQGGGNANLWRSMRMLKVFTPQDLALHSTNETVEVSAETARLYCGILLKAQYLRVLRKAVPGKHQAQYRFIRDTGPQSPQVQRVKQVFDPNIQEVTYYPEVRK